MDWVIELLKMVAALGVAFFLLAWIGGGNRSARRKKGEPSPDDELVDDMGEIGAAGGLLGGDLEGLFTGRFALRRAKIARKNEQQASSEDD